MGFRVPKAMEVEMDAFWKAHEAFMQAHQKMGTEGGDEKPRLLEFYVSKGMEFKNPMDPSSGETGFLIYMMSETYITPQGIANHFELAGKHWDGFKKLPEYLKNYGIVSQFGSAKVLTCLSDKATPFVTTKGSSCLHISMRVPVAKEAEMDMYWKEHELVARQTHVLGTIGDDNKAPRLTSFYIAKGKEMKDPMDPTSAETGNLIYQMSETYAAPGGIPKHMEIMGANWAGMATLPQKIKDYGLLVDIGTTKVLTNFSD